MIALEQYNPLLAQLREEIADIEAACAPAAARSEIEQLEQQMQQPGFWNDTEKSKPVMARKSLLETRIQTVAELQRGLEDVETLIEIANEAQDEDMAGEIDAEFNSFQKKVRERRLATLLTGEYDKSNAILTFHAGAGGTEAQDWAEMLVRMYKMYAADHKFKAKTIDWLDGDEAGIKSASILIEGHNAYGYLKSENGVHRLVRISPFDASGRRHTSFASLEVMPEIPDDIKIDIREEDLRIDTYRSGGAGGQHVNKTSSAVRITHIPTGIVAACQNERSQFQNRDMAMKMLKSKLLKIKEQEHLEKIDDIKGDQKEIAWGSQIRSYVFMPYTLVKDNRTGFENGNITAVMDGDLDGFINAYLVMKSREAEQK